MDKVLRYDPSTHRVPHRRNGRSLCSTASSGMLQVFQTSQVSLFCVIVSILACYAGGIQKTIYPDAGQSLVVVRCEFVFRVCMLGDRLLQAKLIVPQGANLADICDYCTTKLVFLSLVTLQLINGHGKFLCEWYLPGVAANGIFPLRKRFSRIQEQCAYW